jgi:signal recognition particle subunit SEC65
MEKEIEILTPEEIEEIIRKLEADYPELRNPGQTEKSDKAGAE